MSMYCTKTKTQRTREYMREQRLKNRDNELLNIIQGEQDDNIYPDTSNTMNQISNDTTNDPIITTINCPISPSPSESSNECELDRDVLSDDDLEDRSDSEDVDEFILLYDLNNQTRLYSSCPLSIREACLAVIKLVRRLNLDKSGIKHLLDGIRSLFPPDAKLPRTAPGLMKIIGKHPTLFDASRNNNIP